MTGPKRACVTGWPKGICQEKVWHSIQGRAGSANEKNRLPSCTESARARQDYASGIGIMCQGPLPAFPRRLGSRGLGLLALSGRVHESCGLSRPCGESGQPGAPRKGLAQVSYLPLGTMRATERNSGKPPTDEVDGPRICAQGLVVVHLVHGRLHVQIVGQTAHVEGGFQSQGTVAEHLGVSVS